MILAEYAAITRELNKMAEEDPAMREFVDAWNEVTAAFEQRACEAQEREAPLVWSETAEAAEPLKKAA